tara:strand:- start:5237 stop:5806 length:570 start_codon:yes stop_codon:yes gene_type:complete
VGHFNAGIALSCGCIVPKKGDMKLALDDPKLVDIARDWLRQDEATGQLFWKKKGRKAVIGARAGTVGSHGYRQVYIGARNHREHRLCWLIHYGQWPKSELDHVNGIKDDNRICNLREVTRAENLQNIQKASTRSKSGVRGVHLDSRRGCWVAEIRVEGKPQYLGSFETKAEAANAYREAKSRFHIGGDL